MLKLINAKPSPFGRKVVIAMLEKGLPFEIQWDIPWHADTSVGRWNPLEQLPILLAENGEVAYESSYILDWLETRFPVPPLVPKEPEDLLRMKLFRALAVTVMEAIVRINFELARPPEQHSRKWIERHQRKINGGIREIGRLVDGKPFAVAGMLTHADLEVGSVLGQLDFLVQEIPALEPVLLSEGGWRALHPCLDGYVAGLEHRPSFKQATYEMVRIHFDQVVG